MQEQSLAWRRVLPEIALDDSPRARLEPRNVEHWAAAAPELRRAGLTCTVSVPFFAMPYRDIPLFFDMKCDALLNSQSAAKLLPPQHLFAFRQWF